MLLHMQGPTWEPNSRWSLPVEGYGDAVVISPQSTSPAPVVIVLHGAWDRPEWVCDVYAKVTTGREWVVCLRGKLRPEVPPDGARWTLGTVKETEDELNAVLTSLRSRVGDRAAPGIAVLSGFSKGASHAAALSRREPDRFRRLLLVEGGLQLRTLTARKTAGQRIAMACGTQRCIQRAKKACAKYQRLGGACFLRSNLAVGHSYNSPFANMGSRLYHWLNSDQSLTAPNRK